MFGMNYEEIGSKDKGLILKSSGKIKIQWGKKFIDLIDSNGNLKVKESIKSIDSLSSIKENGFYYLDGALIAKINDSVLKIVSKEDNIYISFIEKQDIDESLKELALKNIGLIYETLSEENKYPKNGIVYIADEENLYSVKNGIITKYKSEIKTPINQQVIIDKDNNEEGSLIITGNGSNNGIIFNTLKIYSDNSDSVYLSVDNHIFVVDTEEIFRVNSDGISGNRFGIANSDGESVLTIDKINSSILTVDKINSLDYFDVLDTLVSLYKDSEIFVSLTGRTITVTSNLVWYLEGDSIGISRGIGNKTIVLDEELEIPEYIEVLDILYPRLIQLGVEDASILGLHYKRIKFL